MKYEYKKVFQHHRIGIEILHNLNLLQLTDSQIMFLKNKLWNHGVVVIKKQQITASELKDFAKNTFNDLTLGNRDKPIDPDIPVCLQSPGVSILGNSKGINKNIAGKVAWQWHQDKDHLPRTKNLDMNSLYVVMLYGVKIPPEDLDGKPHTTLFIDLIEAYNNLSEEKRQKLETDFMYHPSPLDSQIRKLHPVVSTHKVTGKKGLYLGSDTSIFKGLENNLEEAKKYWQELLQTILKITPVYVHVWQPGDILFWDNSQVMHTGIPYDNKKYQRIALRVGVVENNILSTPK